MHRYAGRHNEDNTLNFSEGVFVVIIDNGEYIAGTLKKSLGTSLEV